MASPTVLAALAAEISRGEASIRVHAIYSDLLVGTNGLFRTGATPDTEMELARMDCALERQSYRADRWRILGEFIRAGGFDWVKNCRRREGRVVPDMSFFFRARSIEDPASGGRRTVVDGSMMLRSVHSALDWDENGRKEVQMVGKWKGAEGGVPRVEPQSDEAGRRSAELMRARGASGAGAVTTMSGEDVLSQFEEGSSD